MIKKARRYFNTSGPNLPDEHYTLKREKLIVKREGEIALIIFNNPKAYNSFDLELITYILENVKNLSKDEKIKGIIFSGEGKAFCTGGD